MLNKTGKKKNKTDQSEDRTHDLEINSLTP